jgi:hypothetical protein
MFISMLSVSPLSVTCTLSLYYQWLIEEGQNVVHCMLKRKHVEQEIS